VTTTIDAIRQIRARVAAATSLRCIVAKDVAHARKPRYAAQREFRDVCFGLPAVIEGTGTYRDQASGGQSSRAA
jgi:hypothetical protein